MDIITKIQKINDSQGIELSKDMLKSIGITDLEQQVKVCVKNNRIVITKYDSQDSRLMQNYRHLIDEPNIGEVDLSADNESQK